VRGECPPWRDKTKRFSRGIRELVYFNMLSPGRQEFLPVRSSGDEIGRVVHNAYVSNRLNLVKN